MLNVRRTTLFSVALSLVLLLSLVGYVGQAQAAGVLPGDCSPSPNWPGYYSIASVQALQFGELIKIEFTNLANGSKWTEGGSGPYNSYNYFLPAGSYRVVMKEGAAGTVRVDYTITCSGAAKPSLDSFSGATPFSVSMTSAGGNITVSKDLTSTITKSGDGYQIAVTNASGGTDTMTYYMTADSNLSVDSNMVTLTVKGSKVVITRDTKYKYASTSTDATDIALQSTRTVSLEKWESFPSWFTGVTDQWGSSERYIYSSRGTYYPRLRYVIDSQFDAAKRRLAAARASADTDLQALAQAEVNRWNGLVLPNTSTITEGSAGGYIIAFSDGVTVAGMSDGTVKSISMWLASGLAADVANNTVVVTKDGKVVLSYPYTTPGIKVTQQTVK